jgi:hypothetical protein
MVKRARKLAEESSLPKNSILKHLHAGLGANKSSTKEKAGKIIQKINFLLLFYLFFYSINFFYDDL